MRRINAIVALIGLCLAYPNILIACESYVEISLDEIKEYRDVLQKEGSDPLDRLFAFEQMACSDSPNIRHYAMKEGLDNIKDPLVRNEIMLKAMMQKTRIDVELASAKTLTAKDKDFIANNGGTYSKLIVFKSESDGCISLYGRDVCDGRYSLWVKGDKVELNYSPVVGQFQLTDSNELVGTLRAGDNASYTNIPAIIKLF